jgi:hypothetical protein
MIDGVTSRPFSAIGMAPIAKPDISYADEIINLSREQFANPREKIEETIRNWHVEKIGAKEPTKKLTDKVSDGDRPRGERSSIRSDSRSNDRSDGPRRSSGRSDRFDRAPEGVRDRNTDNRPRIDNGPVSIKSPEKIEEKKINPLPPPAPVAPPIVEQPSKPVVNHVSLNALNNNTENKIKNNQKEIKPENAAALRSALLSVMGDIPTDTAPAEPKIIKEDLPKEKNHTDTKTGALTPDDLKRILDIDQ